MRIARCFAGALLLALALTSCGAGSRSDGASTAATTAKPRVTTITGIVRSNLTLAGLRAKITGAAKATTDARGRFLVQVLSPTSTLVVSAAGYEKARIKPTRSPLTVTLNADPATTVRQETTWEAQQRYDRVWRLVHPDARRYITKAAFIGSLQQADQEGYSAVSVTVKGVYYVTWTMPNCKVAAFGPKTYRNTAAIRTVLHQATPAGGLEDLPSIQHRVRVNGQWRFFPTAGCDHAP